MKAITKAERAFAKRLLRRAARRAEQAGNVTLNQEFLWKFVCEASWKPKRA